MHRSSHNTHHRRARSPLRRLLLGVLLPAVLQTNLFAREPVDDSRTFPMPIPDVRATIDNAHTGASELLNDFASQIDNFFGEEIAEDIANETRATVRLDFSNPPNEAFSTTAKLKLRLVLPRSQQRIRLLLDVDEREDEDAVEALVDEDLDRAFSLAFRFIRNASENTRFNIDLGARRYDSKFQTFARLRVLSKFHRDEGWSFNFKNDLREYYSSGYSNRTSFDFWHALNEDNSMIFRSSTNFNWEKIHSGARIDHSFGIYKNLQRKSLLAFEVLAGYNTSPAEDENHYEGHTARIRYRKNFHRPWFHYELWPSVSWLTEADSDPKLGALIRLEVQFGKYR